ncbi:MAG: alpha/beta hydrolase [Acidobacteriota bacterium]
MFPATSRRVDLEGPAGRLEASLEEPRGALCGAAVIAHPHPLHGGTMHNKVVCWAAKGAVAAGVAALRFNFRGVGDSAGRHDQGRGETDDLRAALRFLSQRYQSQPLLAGGFSFGAAMALRAGMEDPRVVGLMGIGTPLAHATFDFLLAGLKPVLLLHGENDPHGDIRDLRALARRLGNRAHLVVIPGVGHFFQGHLDRVQDAVTDFCARLVGSPSGCRQEGKT